MHKPRYALFGTALLLIVLATATFERAFAQRMSIAKQWLSAQSATPDSYTSVLVVLRSCPLPSSFDWTLEKAQPDAAVGCVDDLEIVLQQHDNTCGLHPVVPQEPCSGPKRRQRIPAFKASYGIVERIDVAAPSEPKGAFPWYEVRIVDRNRARLFCVWTQAEGRYRAALAPSSATSCSERPPK